MRRSREVIIVDDSTGRTKQRASLRISPSTCPVINPRAGLRRSPEAFGIPSWSFGHRRRRDVSVVMDAVRPALSIGCRT